MQKQFVLFSSARAFSSSSDNKLPFADVRDMPPAAVLEQLREDMEPKMTTVVKGQGQGEVTQWRKPRLSARAVARLRKEFRRQGVEELFPEAAKPFGWKPPRNPREREPKGKKFVREKEVRQKKVSANMAKMDKWIADEKQKRVTAKLKERKGLLEWYYPPRTAKKWRPPSAKRAEKEAKIDAAVKLAKAKARDLQRR